jgi:hypothetical protein
MKKNKVLYDENNKTASEGFGFDSRGYQIFWEVVGLERGPLSLVITIEELLEGKSIGSGLENRRVDYATSLYPQELALTSLTSGCCLVGIVRSQAKATELWLVIMMKKLAVTTDRFKWSPRHLGIATEKMVSRFCRQ